MKRSRLPAPCGSSRVLILLFGLSILVSACSTTQTPGTPPPATSTPAPPTAAAAIPNTPTATALLPQTGPEPTTRAGCPPTPLDARSEEPLTMGPVNNAGTSSAKGDRLVITGTVYDSACQPVPGMPLRFWQTDAEGVYGPGHGTENMVCCYYGGETVTDAQGRFTLLTVMPGVYKDESSPPPAHIHVEGEHPSGARLISEIVFRDDPYLRGGGVYENPPPITLTEAEDDQGRYLTGAADLLLPEAIEPEIDATATAAEAEGSTAQGLQTYRIQPGESSVSYQIREKFADIADMVSPLGVTKGVEGEIQLNMGQPPALQSMTVRVDLRELRTDDPNRDEKLWDRWLVTRDFPYATFTAREIEGGPTTYQEGQPVTFNLLGDLTIRDVTRPAVFTVTAALTGDALTGEAETKILMSDFGIDPPDLLGFVKVEDEVTVRVQLHAVRI